MIVIHGLKNCDSCRKAVAFLQEKGVTHRLHDLRQDGLSADMIEKWCQALGWERLLNRRGTTWRGLPAEQTGDLTETKAKALMMDHPALIKRPLFQKGENFLLGFSKAEQQILADW